MLHYTIVFCHTNEIFVPKFFSEQKRLWKTRIHMMAQILSKAPVTNWFPLWPTNEVSWSSVALNFFGAFSTFSVFSSSSSNDIDSFRLIGFGATESVVSSTFSLSTVEAIFWRLVGAGVPVTKVAADERLGRTFNFIKTSAGDPFSVTPCIRV